MITAGIKGYSIVSVYASLMITIVKNTENMVISPFPRKERIDPVIPTAVNLLAFPAMIQNDSLAARQKLLL